MGAIKVGDDDVVLDDITFAEVDEAMLLLHSDEEETEEVL